MRSNAAEGGAGRRSADIAAVPLITVAEGRCGLPLV